MSRTANHDERRAVLAAAVAQIVEQEGYAAVTVASTARRAGVSVGAVQHYFPSKEAMMVFAFEAMRQRAWGRIDHIIAEGESDSRSIGETLRAAAMELMPVDAMRRQEFALRAAFAAQLHVHPDIYATYQRETESIHHGFELALRNGKECGEVPADIDVPATATRLAAVVTGLAMAAWIDRRGLQDAIIRAALDQELRAVFSGYCHHYDRPVFAS